MKNAKPLPLGYPYTGLFRPGGELSGPLPAGASPNLIGVMEFKGSLRRGYGSSDYIAGTTITGNPIRIEEFLKTNGDNWFLIVTDQAFYKYLAAAGGSWSSLGAYTGTALRLCSSTTYANQFIFTDGVNPVKTWDGTTLSNLGDVTKTCTISIASPAVITCASHGFSIGMGVKFSTTGALPTGLTAGTLYYIITAGFTTGAFEVSLTPGGAAVNTSGTQSGTQSVTGGSLTGIVARIVDSFWDHLLLMSTTEASVNYFTRLRWSTVFDPTNFYTGTSGVYDISGTTDPILACGPVYDRRFLYRGKTIYELLYVGSPDIFKPIRIVDGVGILAPDTLESLDYQSLFLGTDDVYIFNGRTLEPIGEPIWDLLFGPDAITNPAAMQNSKGIFCKELGEYFLAVPTGTNTSPDTIFRYDLGRKQWWRKKAPFYVSAFGAFTSAASASWSSLVGAWSAQSWVWTGSGVQASSLVTLIGGYSVSGTGKVGKMDYTTSQDYTVYEESYRESEDISLGANSRIEEFWAEIQGIGTCKLSYSKTKGSSWIDLTTKTLTSTNWDIIKWGVNQTSQNIRFKITLLTGDLKVRRQTVWITPKVR